LKIETDVSSEGKLEVQVQAILWRTGPSEGLIESAELFNPAAARQR